MPASINNTHVAGSIEETKRQVEAICALGRPFVVQDLRHVADDITNELHELRRLLGGGPLPILYLTMEMLTDFHIFVPSDELARFVSGRPVVVAPVPREPRDPRPAHRPDDTPVVKAAKEALEVGAYLSLSALTETRLSQNSNRLTLTRAEAEDRERETLTKKIWKDSDDARNMNLFVSLTDRGRRLAAGFFGVVRAKQVKDALIARVRARLTTGEVTVREIEAHHQEHVGELARNVERAVSHERAMQAWSRTVERGLPIAPDDAIEVTNAVTTRQSAAALMRIAIAGDLNPADTHSHILTMREAFELGRLLGRLQRGRPITLSPLHAALFEKAFETAAAGRCQTQADACELLIIEAAREARDDPEFWVGAVARVTTSGAPELIEP